MTPKLGAKGQARSYVCCLLGRSASDLWLPGFSGNVHPALINLSPLFRHAYTLDGRIFAPLGNFGKPLLVAMHRGIIIPGFSGGAKWISPTADSVCVCVLLPEVQDFDQTPVPNHSDCRSPITPTGMHFFANEKGYSSRHGVSSSIISIFGVFGTPRPEEAIVWCAGPEGPLQDRVLAALLTLPFEG